MIIKINSSNKNEFIEITSLIKNSILENKWRNGIIFLNVLHTTAALTINENADNDVKTDLINALNELVPDIRYYHNEGNSDSHLKASLIGSDLMVQIENGNPILGKWQGIYFCEFDGPRINRQIKISFVEK
ncbi:MAG: secondary thiamine-phosphate synthase enzyme YjbQ [Sebaldella sp.]|nr:secondary thiamine-phosphate synthase enzyme YjbQ [Sebaldella sp.]